MLTSQRSWQDPPPPSRDTTPLPLVLLIAIAAGVLFLGLVTAGQHLMCAVYADRPDGPSYCQPTSTPEEQ